MRSGRYRFGRINFPNGDMVGHTGVEKAIIASVEAVDECTDKLIKAVNELGGITLVLADHGNADEMYTLKDGKKIVCTAHSLNPVPCAIVDAGYHGEYRMANLSQRGLVQHRGDALEFAGVRKAGRLRPIVDRVVIPRLMFYKN